MDDLMLERAIDVITAWSPMIDRAEAEALARGILDTVTPTWTGVDANVHLYS